VIYFEDLEPGGVGTFGAYRVSEQEILDFAERYNPLPYHTDPNAESPFGGGLTATGWQTGSIMMRMATDNWIGGMASLGGTGIEARFRRPVRPGDVLRVEIEVLETDRSLRSPDRGTVRWLGTVLNQSDECVLTCIVTMRVACRNAAVA
jgi:acyl dehydratase